MTGLILTIGGTNAATGVVPELSPVERHTAIPGPFTILTGGSDVCADRGDVISESSE